jgi:uncharacterized protein (TIGR02270 family)
MMVDPVHSQSIVISVVIEQHAEAAAFHWLLRDAAVCAPHYSLDDLAKLDNRLDAHLDGLRIAGGAGWEMCQEQLSWEEAGEVFVAAVLAFASGQETHIQAVLEAGSASPELARGLVSALGWMAYQQAETHLTPLLTAESSTLRRIGIAACAVHRRDPGYALTAALSANDPALQARALRAVGQFGRVDLLSWVQSNVTADDARCRYAAAWSAALLGDIGALPALQTIASSKVPYREDAAKVALRRMDLRAAHDWRLALAQEPDTMRLAIIGAGVIGDPASIPWLIDQMTIPELARVAGESFSMITGVDLAYEDLEGEWPEGFEAGPTEDPEDENVAMDPDEDLPWPDPGLIDKWWYTHRRDFLSGTRYLVGKPMSFAWLKDILRNGRQRQRSAAAVELAIRQPGQPLFEVRAPGFRQQQLLRVNR